MVKLGLISHSGVKPGGEKFDFFEKYEQIRLIEEMKEHPGAEIEKIDISKDLFHCGTDFKYLDSAISRVYLHSLDPSLAMVHSILPQIDHDTRLVNKFYPMFDAQNKYVTHHLLIKNNIPTIAESFLTLNKNIAGIKMKEMIHQGIHLVLKRVYGTEGVGMAKLETPVHAEEWVEEKMFKPYFFQPFVPHKGFDTRIIVVGDQVIGGMKRMIQSEGEWRSNISRGAKGEYVQPDAEMTEMAVKACKAVELDYCGVDILEYPDGKRVVLEVNSTPDYEGFEESSNINVAKSLVDYMVEVSKK